MHTAVAGFAVVFLTFALEAWANNSGDQSISVKIIKPNGNLWNLKYPNGKNSDGSWSQLRQDKCVLKLLNNMNGGYFIEAGGFDGESHSNTLFLEKRNHWTGIVIEPNPFLFKKIRQLHRNCSAVNVGISINGSTMSLPFRLGGTLGGFVSEFSDSHSQRLDRNIKNGHPEFKDEGSMGRVIMVPVVPLNHILEVDGNRNRVVDFFSLDTEGSEVKILNSIDFKELTVGVMIVEHNGDADNIVKIDAVMLKAGFVQMPGNGQDGIFYNPKYFHSKGIPIPNKDVPCH